MAMAVATTHFSALASSTASPAACMPKLSIPKRFDGLRICSTSSDMKLQQCVASSGSKSSRGGMPPRVVCSTDMDYDIMCAAGRGSKIMLVGAEVAPWSKTGGLGDVMGGLAAALAARGHDVMTVSPRYDQYYDCWDTGVLKELRVGDKIETVRYFHARKRGVDRVFVDHPLFLAKVWGQTGSKLYGPETGEDYKDNQLRFSLFAQAAIEAALLLNLNGRGPYGENVIFVAHDWHSALLPCYLRANYKAYGRFKNAKLAFCIHNMSYQGRFAFEDFSHLNLPDSFKSSFDFYDGHKVPVKGRKINWMKAGILEADKVLTVSPNYALELKSAADRGVELDPIVRMRDVEGITNGMDTQEWDPSTDKYLEVKYDSTTVTEGKAALKEILQAELGLPLDPTVPLLGFIGRLEEQKGSDILSAAVPEILKDNVQLVVLGTGKKIFEKELEELEVKYPSKARGVVKFSPPLAHLITAAADFMVIPSRFEPCGLIQLQSMRYGTLPVVASTGGLVDTVKDGVTGFQVGKSFSVDCEAVDPTDVEAFTSTVHRAVEVYGTPDFPKMVKACMEQDLSWKGPAKVWEEVLLRLQVEGSKPGVDGEEIAPLAKENVPVPTAP